MSKVISIKLTKVGPTAGPFNIYDQWGNIIAENISRDNLITGVHYTVDDNVTMVRLASMGTCGYEKIISLTYVSNSDFHNTSTKIVVTGCIWRHLRNPEIFHLFYGNIEPYIIEYPFAYEHHDEILQNIKDYTKVYKYFADPYEISNEPNKVQIDGVYFNKAVIYNGQQCSGILNLVPKPKHNLKVYSSYPIFRSDSKDIIYTKSDHFYQFNTFWSVVKDKTVPLFERNCDSLSTDKVVNQSNMDYSLRSFKKEPFRAKDARIRLYLTDRSDAHIVSQIIFTSTQISYK